MAIPSREIRELPELPMLPPGPDVYVVPYIDGKTLFRAALDD